MNDKKEKVEKQTNNQNANNNRGNTKKIVVRHRHLSLLKSWMILGLIMMVLKNTIWPEVDTQLAGFYKVSTLWITVLDEICNFVFPYLNSAGEWIVQMTPKAIDVVKELWPVVYGAIALLFQSAIKLYVLALSVMLVSCAVVLLIFVIMYIFKREEAQVFIDDFKKEFSSWWSSITNKEKDPNYNNDCINPKSKPMDANYEQISKNIGTEHKV